MKRRGPRVESPRPLRLQQRVLLHAAPWTAWLLLRSLCSTCRLEVIDKQHFDRVQQKHGTIVAGFWHETLAMALNIYRKTGYYTLTSRSFDGELAARTCAAFGLEALRGSSSRGGTEALRSLIQASQNVPGIGFTLDGPKGPRRVAKAGVAMLSAKTGVPILPNAIVAKPCWRMTRSWDQMAFPKPFGRIICAYAAPIPPPESTDPAALEATRKQVEDSLNELHRRIESNGV